jgi:protease YdgD
MKGLAEILALVLPGLVLASLAGAEAPPQLATREALRGWEAVGQIAIADTGFCTGTLIEPDLVLTSASCVIDEDGTPVDAASIRFRAGLIEDVAIAESAVLRTMVPPAYRHVDPVPIDMIPQDLALLELATPIPSSVIAPFSLALPEKAAEFAIVFYGGRRIMAATLKDGCTLFGADGGLVALDCGLGPVTAGAPMLEKSGYRAKLVGVVSAHTEVDDKVIQLGMDLPDQVAALKAALRRGEATSRATATKTGTGAKVLTP